MSKLYKDQYRVISQRITVDVFKNPKDYGIDAEPKQILENFEEYKFDIFEIVKKRTIRELESHVET